MNLRSFVRAKPDGEMIVNSQAHPSRSFRRRLASLVASFTSLHNAWRCECKFTAYGKALLCSSCQHAFSLSEHTWSNAGIRSFI